MRTYEVAGVTVISMKLEQSSAREVTSGIFPVRVPVTALAQLSALQLSLSGVTARPPWAMAKASMKDQNFIVDVGEVIV